MSHSFQYPLFYFPHYCLHFHFVPEILHVFSCFLYLMLGRGSTTAPHRPVPLVHPTLLFFMSFKYHVRLAQSKRSPLSTHASTILGFIFHDSQDPLSSSLTLAHRPPGPSSSDSLLDVLLWSHPASQHADLLLACSNTSFCSLSGRVLSSKRAISSVIYHTPVSSSFLLPMAVVSSAKSDRLMLTLTVVLLSQACVW